MGTLEEIKTNQKKNYVYKPFKKYFPSTFPHKALHHQQNLMLTEN